MRKSPFLNPKIVTGEIERDEKRPRWEEYCTGDGEWRFSEPGSFIYF
jgi:hypothetical protein